jgi:protocatechuate 4,5-dioxygenase alpha subunit
MRAYWLNRAFNALNDPANRTRWQEDRAAYLDDFPLSDADRKLVLDGDWPGCVDAGASIYTLTKVGATTGESLLQMGAQMRGQDIDAFWTFVREQNERNNEYIIPFTLKAGDDG